MLKFYYKASDLICSKLRISFIATDVEEENGKVFLRVAIPDMIISAELKTDINEEDIAIGVNMGLISHFFIEPQVYDGFTAELSVLLTKRDYPEPINKEPSITGADRSNVIQYVNEYLLTVKCKEEITLSAATNQIFGSVMIIRENDELVNFYPINEHYVRHCYKHGIALKDDGLDGIFGLAPSTVIRSLILPKHETIMDFDLEINAEVDAFYNKVILRCSKEIDKLIKDFYFDSVNYRYIEPMGFYVTFKVEDESEVFSMLPAQELIEYIVVNETIDPYGFLMGDINENKIRLNNLAKRIK